MKYTFVSLGFVPNGKRVVEFSYLSFLLEIGRVILLTYF